MSHDERLRCAIHLLELVSATDANRIPSATACAELSCSEDELDGYLDLISMLADRQSGSRAVIFREGADVVLLGDAARMSPLRLTLGESIALESVLESLELGGDVCTRLRAALVPELLHDTARQHLIGRDVSFGSWYPKLAEAIADGVRCRIGYRSHDELEARVRTIDPLELETASGAAYLIAWDVERDAERRYRLERIESVAFTDDSVVTHARTSSSIAESLAQGTERVTLEMPRHEAERLTWAGVRSIDDGPDDGTVRVQVDVSSPRWLFDQVLSAGGAMRIVEPAAAVEELVEYARSLAGADAAHEWRS